jgi:phage tail sheath protein FI
MDFKTPGVCIHEEDAFPSSLAAPSTCVPAFIGMTETHPADYSNQPMLITSLLQYVELFGKAPAEPITVTVDEKNQVPIQAELKENKLKQIMYYNLQLFFSNGGGVCYIVSLGTGDYSKASEDEYTRAIDELETKPDITLLVLTDAGYYLDDGNRTKVYGAALDHCNKMQNRFVIFDTNYDDKGTYSSFRDSIDAKNLKYGAAYTPYLNTSNFPVFCTNEVEIKENKVKTGCENGINVTYIGANKSPKCHVYSIKYLKEKAEDFIGSELEELFRILEEIAGSLTAKQKKGIKDYISSKVFKNEIENVEDKVKEGLIKKLSSSSSAEIKDILLAVLNNIPQLILLYKYGVGCFSYDGKLLIIGKGKVVDGHVICINGFHISIDGEFEIDNYDDFSIPLDSGDCYSATIEQLQITNCFNNNTEVSISIQPEGSVTFKAEGDKLEISCKEDTDNLEILREWLGHTGKNGFILEALNVNGAAFSISDLIDMLKNMDKSNKDFGSQKADVKKKLEKVMIFETESLIDIKTKNTQLYNQIISAINSQVKINNFPPSGAIAGIYNKVDDQKGVWQSPANIALNSVVAPSVNISAVQQADLNVDATTGKSINAIRPFLGKGTLVWGARTLDGNSNDWRYISVRRLVSYIENTLQIGLQNYVFESNNAMTWLKVRAMMEPFLEDLWQQGALVGNKVEDAFFVNLGLGTTMTPQDILEGRMIVSIGLATARPAEFIVLNVTQLQQS